MEPTISVYRKGEDLYLTLEGEVSGTSSQHLFEALKKAVMTSLKCVAPDSSISYLFRTHGNVNFKKTVIG